MIPGKACDVVGGMGWFNPRPAVNAGLDIADGSVVRLVETAIDSGAAVESGSGSF
jgi:hypothetical protein